MPPPMQQYNTDSDDDEEEQKEEDDEKTNPIIEEEDNATEAKKRTGRTINKPMKSNLFQNTTVCDHSDETREEATMMTRAINSLNIKCTNEKSFVQRHSVKKGIKKLEKEDSKQRRKK